MVGSPGDYRVVYEIDEEASVVLVHWVQQRTVVWRPVELLPVEPTPTAKLVLWIAQIGWAGHV